MDYNIYTTEMSKSVWDKAFFMDKVPGTKCIIDFGCADGAMIHFLAPLFPDIIFVGYDINEQLIKKARMDKPFYANVTYFTDINDIINYILTINISSRELCINFSSVLHEVFSSTGGTEIIKRLVNELEPQYITIRDMYCDEHIPFASESQYLKVWGPLPADKTIEFENKFGHINDWHDITHFLMKLQWVDNGWENEMEENYYSWNIHNLLDFLDDKYIPSFDCRYQLPYLSEKWKKEYDWYNPDMHTHAQFILRRNN